MIMQNKICLITGATSGIGEVAAHELAKMGAHVVILARNRDKALKSQQEIKANSGNDNVDIIIADLSEQSQIRRAADEFNARYPRLDVLINNAGLITGNNRIETSEGHELTLAVNHLAPFLLTSLLFGKLKESPEARVVNVSSIVYLMGTLNLSDIEMRRYFFGLRAYNNSKLYSILFTEELARRLRPYPNITANALHPGIISSNFSKGSGGLTGLFFKLTEPVLTTPEKGAETSVYLASVPEAKKYNGLFFTNKRPARLMNLAITPENGEKLWKVTQELTGTRFLDD
jgi:NAD(P)-dependent dehydrogenase (short-subunit alcohol dehydrogenase family)